MIVGIVFVLALLLNCQLAFVKLNKVPSKLIRTSLLADNNGVTENKTRPWELGRFFKTLQYFDVLRPKFKFFTKAVASNVVKKRFIFWSETERSLLQWGPLDDVVMGGVSKSNLIAGTSFDGNWTGVVTSANNGGFAGIRTKLFTPPFDVSSCDGFEINVTGDGQRYKFIARDEGDWNGVAWSLSFDTIKDKPVQVKIPFKNLKPTKFAKIISSMRNFNQSTLCGIQLTLSKFEYNDALNPIFREGPFRLIVNSIETY